MAKEKLNWDDEHVRHNYRYTASHIMAQAIKPVSYTHLDAYKRQDLYREHHEIEEYLESIIGEVIEVNSIKDMNRAFDADIRKPGGKTIMLWNK